MTGMIVLYFGMGLVSGLFAAMLSSIEYDRPVPATCVVGVAAGLVWPLAVLFLAAFVVLMVVKFIGLLPAGLKFWWTEFSNWRRRRAAVKLPKAKVER
jgi:hypothetical protein